MNDKLISVILCFYNNEKYLSSAIKSVLDQTYQNFELILINDGSTDQSPLIAKKFHDKRIKYHENLINLGYVDSYNKGFELAIGEYVAMMDSDDICDVRRLEKQLNYLNINSLDVCGTNVNFFGDFKGKSECPEKDIDIKTFMIIGNPIKNPTILVKSEIIKKYKFSKKFPVAIDFYTWIKIALDGYKFGILKEYLLYSRWHPTQMSSVGASQGFIDGSIICENYANSQKDILYQLKYLNKIKLGFAKKISIKEFIFASIALLIVIKKRKSDIKILAVFIQRIYKTVYPKKIIYFFNLMKIINKYKLRFFFRDKLIFLVASNAIIYDFIIKLRYLFKYSLTKFKNR